MADLGALPHEASTFAKRIHETRAWLAEALRELRAAPSSESASNVLSPFEHYRDTSSRLSLSAFEGDTPRDRGIRAHVTWLIQRRILFAHDVKVASLAKEPSGTLRLDRTEPISYEGAKRGLLTEAHPFRIQAYVDALASASAEVDAQTRARNEVRFEVAQKLDLEAHDASLPCSVTTTRECARLFLDRTRELARASRLAIDPSQGEARGTVVATFRTLAANPEATRGFFPARLNHAWLHDTFPTLATARIDPKSGHPNARLWLRALSPAIFATSFGRALYSLGHALGASVEEPVLATISRGDAMYLHEATVGCAFSALLVDATFCRKALGLTASDARVLTREVARTALVVARLRAARVLADTESLGDLAQDVFGGDLPSGARMALLGTTDEARRDFLAVLRSSALGTFLRNTFDEDWFRNPRTADFFLAAEPIVTTPEELRDMASSLTRSLEDLVS